MTTLLNLGVVDQPYDVGGQTTGEVARILEDKYEIMGTFWRVHETENTTALEDSVAGAMESLLMGQVIDPWARGTAVIATRFKTFINSGEAERVGIPGTPTKAAQKGTTFRKKRSYKGSNGRRVSFRNTGLYVGSSIVWVE